MSLECGARAELRHVVGDADTAVALRSGDVAVLGTPKVVALCEEASVLALADALPAGCTTVGMRVQLDHLQPTATGIEVVVEAVLEKVEGRRLTFHVAVNDPRGLVATGRVIRVMVETERFMEKGALRPPPRRRPLAAMITCTIGLTVVAGACTDDAPTGAVGGITLAPQTRALPEGSAKPRTTPAPPTQATVPVATGTTDAGATTVAGQTTAAPTSTTTTTIVVLAPCDLNVVIADLGPAEQGYAFADLRCSQTWATVVAKAFNPGVSTDELIVMRAENGHWAVVAGGGATTCTSAGVPPEHTTALDCARWEV